MRQEGSDVTEVLVDDKDNAVDHARERGPEAKVPSQVIVHTGDGQFETEHTYGDDPRDVPG